MKSSFAYTARFESVQDIDAAHLEGPTVDTLTATNQDQLLIIIDEIKDGTSIKTNKKHPDTKIKIRTQIVNPTPMTQYLNSYFHKQMVCTIFVGRKGIYPQYANPRTSQRLNGISTKQISAKYPTSHECKRCR